MDEILIFHSINQFTHLSFFLPEIIVANSTDCLGWPSSKTRCVNCLNALCPGSPTTRGRFWRRIRNIERKNNPFKEVHLPTGDSERFVKKFYLILPYSFYIQTKTTKIEQVSCFKKQARQRVATCMPRECQC